MAKLNKDDARGNIKVLIDEYKKIFPIEFAMFLKQMEIVRLQQYDKFAEVKGTDALERKLVEYPESLFIILQQKLSSKELEWFGTKEGVRWFAKKYPEFKVAYKI